MAALLLFPGTTASRRWAGLWRTLLVLLFASWTTGCASLPSQVERTRSTGLATPEQTALGQLVQTRRQQAKVRSESGFKLLDSVDIAFTSRLALIDAAQRTLDLQYYAIHADATTEVLLQHMREAAQRGVRIRILLDDFNSVGADAQVLRLAFERNVEMRLFNPLPGSRASLVQRILGSLGDVGRIQKRMHNKLFIADNAWGIAGGRNLGDAYFGGDDRSNFVDLDVLAAGRIVRSMSGSFDRYWNDELAYPVQALLSPEDLERLRQRAPSGEPGAAMAMRTAAPKDPSAVLPGVKAQEVSEAKRTPLDLRRVPLAWAPAVLLADRPDKIAATDDEADASETVIDGLLALMQKSRREVLVISPYFVPGPEMMATFRQLRARGVQVRVLTNSLASNDAPAAHAGYARYRPELLRLGVELHEMRADRETAAQSQGLGSGGSLRGAAGSGVGGSKGGRSRASLHSKAAIIDRQLVVIGSMNLDLRSQLKNSEVALVIRSTTLAQQAAELVEASFQRAAWKVVFDGDRLLWRAPAGAPFKDTRSEPEAGLKLRLLVNLLGPLAPDEML